MKIEVGSSSAQMTAADLEDFKFQFQFQLSFVSPRTPRPFGKPLLLATTAGEPPCYSPTSPSPALPESPQINSSQSGSAAEEEARSSSSSPPRVSPGGSRKRHDGEKEKQKVHLGPSEIGRDGKYYYMYNYYYCAPPMKETMKKKKRTTTALPYRMNAMFGCIDYGSALDSIVKMKRSH